MQTNQSYLLQTNTKNSLDKISKIFRIVLPIYWAILTYMLLKPGEENQEYWFMFSGIDKIIHLSIFAFLGLSFSATFPKTQFSIYIYIMLIYAFLTEILQEEMHLGRSMETLDIIADTIGIFIGYFFFKKIKNLF